MSSRTRTSPPTLVGPAGSVRETSGVVVLGFGLRRRQREAGGLGGLLVGEPHLGLGPVVERRAGDVVEHRVLVALDRETLGLRAVVERRVRALAVGRLVGAGRLLDRLVGLVGRLAAD